MTTLPTHPVRVVGATVVLVASALLTSGCFSAPDSTDSRSSPPTGDPSAPPTDPATPDASGPFDPSAIVDGGPRDGAAGEARQDADGFWYYRVVDGDVGATICDRLGRAWWQLETLDGQGGFDCNSTVYVDQVVIPTTYSQEEMESANGLPAIPTSNPFETE